MLLVFILLIAPMKVARFISQATKSEWRLVAVGLVVVSLAWFGLVSTAAQTSKGKRILTIRINDSPEGSRVTALADLALNDYEAYRRGDRFFVKIPSAELVTNQPYSHGNGFDDIHVQKSGDSLIISFKLQPGATARVDQRLNRLDVVFSALSRPVGSNVASSTQPSFPENNGLQNRERRTTDPARSLPPNSPSTNGLADKTAIAANLRQGSKTGEVSFGEQTSPGSATQGTNANIPGTASPSNGSPVLSSTTEGSTQVGTSQSPQVQTSDGSDQGSTKPGSSQSRSYLPATQSLVATRHWMTLHWRWVVALVAALIVVVLLVMLARRRRRNRQWRGEVGPTEASEYVSLIVADSPADTVVVQAEVESDTLVTPAALPVQVAPEQRLVAASPTDEVVQAEVESEGQVTPAESPVQVEIEGSVAAESPSIVLEVEEVLVEPPLANKSVDLGLTHLEVQKLLAGREYDAGMIGSRDSASRRVVVAGLLAALAGRNLEQRARARRAFVQHGYLDETARDLQTADSSAERAAAARKLGVVGDAVATAHLVTALYDTAPEVRRASVESLGQIGNGAAISPLTDLLARETNRLVPEAVIRHAINSITVTEAKRASMSDKPSLRAVDQTQNAPIPRNTEFVDLVNSLQQHETPSKADTSRISTPSLPAWTPLSAPTSQGSMSAEEVRLHQEEQALRRAAETLARKRLEAEAARRKAEEEARQEQARAENEAKIRAAEESRRIAEEEAPKRSEEEAFRKMLEEESRMELEEAARSRSAEAHVSVEPEADFRLEAETLRRAAEELARKRAEVMEARKRIEAAAQSKLEQARQQAEEEARLRAEAEARARAEEEARFRAEEEARLQAAEEVRRIKEEAERRQAEAETARRLPEAESSRKAEEELHLEVETDIHAEQEARRLAEEELRRRAEEERRRVEFETKLREEEASRVAEQEILHRIQSENLRKLASERHHLEEQKFLMEQQALLKAADDVARRRQEIEAARLKAEEEVRRLAELQEQIRADEEKRRQAEEERQRLEAEARNRAEEERKRFEDARRRAVEEQKRLEEEARLKAEEETRLLAEARKRIRAEEEARQQAQAERERLEAEARTRAEEEKQRYEEACRRLDEEQKRLEEEARQHAQEEERRLAELEAVRQQVEAQSRLRTEQEQRIRTEIEALYQAEAEQQSRIEAETGRRAEYEARQIADSEAHLRAEREARLVAEEETRARAEAEAQSTQGSVIEPETNTEGASQADAQPLDSSSIPMALLDKLNSSSAEERCVALAVLARFGGEGAFQFITRAFDDSSPEVRNSAVRALCDLQSDRAASVTRALREATPERRRKIGAALATSGLASDAIVNLIGESRESTYDAFSLLFLMAKAGEVQPLMNAIEDYPNIEVRLAVVKLLALSGQAEIVPAFRRLAVRGSLPPEVRVAVMEAIYQISSQSHETTSSAA
jgi:hypothetical protein